MSWAVVLKKAVIDILPHVIAAGANWLKNLGKTPAVNEKSTAADIEQTNAAICKLRENVIAASRKIAENTNDAVVAFSEEQLLNLEDKSDLLERYNISSRSVEDRLHEIQDGLIDFWEDMLHRKISLDNPKCRAVLVLPPGGKKEVETQRLTEEILAETTEEYFKAIQTKFTGLFSDMENDISMSTENLEKAVHGYAELLNSMDNEDEEKYSSILERAYDKSSIYSVIIERTVL